MNDESSKIFLPSKKPSSKPSAKTLEPSSAIYSCYLCCKKFARYSFLESHFKFAHAETEKLCPVCQKVFKQAGLTYILKHRNSHTIKELESSSIGSSTIVSDFKCLKCSSYFVNKIHKLFHDLYHHEKPLFHCTLCQTECISSEHLKEHEVVCSILQESFTKQCAVCLRQFTSSSGYRHHILSHQKSFSCEHCQTSFNSRILLESHLRATHPEKLYLCKFCDRKFLLAVSLKKHHQIFHSDIVYNCDSCGKSFRSKTALAAHTSVHSGVKPFSCRFCNKKFRMKSVCSSHEEQHSSIKKYKCEFCSKLCLKAIDLYFHKRKKHPETFIFQCEFCGCGYNDEQFFKKHKLNCEGRLSKPKNDEKPVLKSVFKCETCHRMFPNNAKLQNHVSIHTGEKPHMCEICGKTFRTKQLFFTHELRHSKSKTYVCKHCGDTFSGMDKLYVHRRTKHADQFIYHCKTCKRVYNSRKHFLIHTQLCETSEETSITMFDSSVDKTELHCYKCLYCEEICQSKVKLLTHEKTHHGKGTPLKCKICHVKFLKFSFLREHMEKHFLNNEINEFICSICNMICNDENCLKTHKCSPRSKASNAELFNSSQVVYSIENYSKYDENNLLAEEEVITLGPNDFQTVLDDDSQNFHHEIIESSNHSVEIVEHVSNQALIDTLNSKESDEAPAAGFGQKTHPSETKDDINAVENQFITEEEFIEEVETEVEMISNENQFIESSNTESGETLVYQCSFCGNDFNDIGILRAHLKSSHDLILEQLEFHFMS